MAAQFLATIVGLLIVYFGIARKVGHYEKEQEHTAKQVTETKDKLEKVFDQLVELGKRVYELFGQLKPRS